MDHTCPEQVPSEFWSLFWNGSSAKDLRLPEDALFVATTLLDGPDPVARTWALRCLPEEALQQCRTMRGYDTGEIAARIDKDPAFEDRKDEVLQYLANRAPDLEQRLYQMRRGKVSQNRPQPADRKGEAGLTSHFDEVIAGSDSMAAGNQKWSFVVAANRLPVRRVWEGDTARWVPSPGGLVSALRPVMSGNPDAVWAGWSGVPGPGIEPFEVDGFQCHPVGVSQGELQLFYEGFSNATLWPLFHDALVPPEYHRTWWDAYRTVNQRYAATVANLAAPGATVWIHDYHLLLVPGLLRQARPDLRIGFYLHIPFPARELYIRMPWRAEIISGLLGADLIGLQTPLGADNFCRAVNRITGAKTTGKVIQHDGRVTQVGAFPIGIDADRIDGLAADPTVQARAADIRETLGSPATVLLGVDRLDYTKGIEVRLRAFRELLAEGRLSADDCVLVQVAEPSRSQVTGYAEVRREVEQMVGDVNGNFGVMGRPVVHYLHQSQPIDELVAMYLIADIMLVTPLRDGMNLVAKEYVASRPDNTGVLVLSEFTGAAQELRTAELINPHDIEGLKTAIEAAAHRPRADTVAAMRAMRRIVRSNTAQRWAERFLARLEACE